MDQTVNPNEGVSRREFLAASSAGLLLGFFLPAFTRPGDAQAPPLPPR